MCRPSQTPHLNLSRVRNHEHPELTVKFCCKKFSSCCRFFIINAVRQQKSNWKKKFKNSLLFWKKRENSKTFFFTVSGHHVPTISVRNSTSRVAVFHFWKSSGPALFFSGFPKRKRTAEALSPAYSTPQESRTKIRLESSSTGSSFPDGYAQARSLGCGFAKR